MASQVVLRSQEQYLGDLIREILINTDLTDVSPGSDLAILLEAIAASQFQISLSSLKILQSTNLESLVGTALDKKAQSLKLPNGIGGIGRRPATQSSGNITVGSAFQKISSKLYSGKPAPFAGSNRLFVENASNFPGTGTVFIGRGTVNRFEGPLPYTSVTNNGSFWTINLGVNLTKSHLNSDLVVLAQGGDRTVPAGSLVQVPGSSDSPATNFATVQDLVIPDGESEGSIGVVCTQFGEVGNVLAGGIKVFVSSPFAGATATNPTSYTNGRSTESDEDLRQRIKNYPSTLSRGTRSAILAAILGASDPESGRTIQSAVVLEPVEPGDFARVFIDDGTGLEPTFGEQAYELLLQAASGQETRFRTAQFPITPAVAEGANTGPFALVSGMTITVHVDEVVETYTVSDNNYLNLSSSTAYEIIRDLNSQSNIVGWRTLDGGKRVVMIDLSGKAETISVEVGDLQNVLGLPIATLRPIFVYKNSELQSFRGHTATLNTRPRNQWSLSPSDLQNVRVRVDGVTQTISVADADFAEFQTTIASATVAQWAIVLSRKIAGVKFTVSGQVLVWSTWQDFSPGGMLEVLETRADGTPAGWIGDTKIWKPVTSGGILEDAGFSKNFQFNRFTGEITFIDKPEAGSTIEIGSRFTRAHLRSLKTTNGLYTLSPLLSSIGNARLVLGFDGEFAIRSSSVSAGDTFTPTQPDSSGATNIVRLTATTTALFLNALVGDWMYLIKDLSAVPAWGSAVEGFYRLKLVGHQKASTDQAYTGLAAVGYSFGSVSASVQTGRTTVAVTQTAHGLQTGDLITVSTAGALGGISSGNLSQTNVVVSVIDSSHFQYTAGAAATSNASGLLDNIGTNLVTVTHALHGFDSGALITTVVASGFAGISSGNLSRTATPLEVITPNTYRYRAGAANGTFPMPAGGNINTLTYLADTWVEFEVSTPQLAAWTPLLGAAQSVSDKMVYLFRSTVQPQLVDFGGSVSTLTVDQVVAAINDSVATGVAVKLTPQQLEIRSSDFAAGTVAVLASVGNAAGMIDAGTDLSKQAHIGFSDSGLTQAAFPVVQSVALPTAASAGYGTRTYLKVDRDLTNITNEADDPAIQAASLIVTYPEGFENVWLTGRQSGLTGRVYNNQTTAPYTGLMRGLGAIRPVNTSDTLQTSPDSLDRYANYSLRLRDLSFNNFDKLVVELDLDPIDKTVAIQLSKAATIQDMDAITGAGKGQVISFRLKDPEDGDKPFFDPTSVYKDYDFSDFKMLTRSVGLYREDVSDRALVLRSADVGANHRLRLSLRLPTDPDQANFAITHSNDFLSGVSRLNLIVTLPSQSLVGGSTLATGTYKVAASASGTLYDWRVTSGLLNSGSTYSPGNVLNISGLSNLSGSYQILASTYNAWGAAALSTTPGSSTVQVVQPSHGYLNGDLVDITAPAPIGGISASNLSGTFPITFINSSTFSYTAASSSPASAGTIDSVTRPAIVLVSTSASVTNGFPTVTVTAAGHGLQTGNLVNVVTSTAIGGISSGNLSQTGASITRIDANNFSYVAGASATSTASGVIDTITRPAVTYSAVPGLTTPGSATVQITQASHGFITGDLVNVSTSTDIGGISAADLTVTLAPIIVTGVNTFTYAADAAAPSSSGVAAVSGGSVTIKSPGSGGLAPSALYSAAQAPIRTWDIVDKTWPDLATAINAYNPAFPVATAEALGTNFVANPIAKPTYMVYPNAVAYAGSDMSGAFNWHSFDTKYSGFAGIWQYDSSSPSLNGIKATVQTDESIFPTTAEASGTAYTPIDEDVYLVPTNTKTLASWLNFNAASSLALLTNIERIRKDDSLQISSKEDGSAGAVRITGVTANRIASSVIGNATTDENSIRLNILAADAKALPKYSVVKVQNTIASEILRPYRIIPTGASITAANMSETNTYFRQTNSLKYIRVNTNTGRLIFLRNGMGLAQTEPLSAGNTVQFTSLGAGLVQVTGVLAGGTAGTGKLSARVGDMMYIQPAPSSPFSVDQRCKALPTSGVTDGAAPEYLGFPVVHVIDENNIVIIAPTITTFNTVTLAGGTADTDLVFLPAVWNEKNVRTNRREGTDFDALYNQGKAYFLVKALGQGFISVWMQNAGTEAADDLRLDAMSVGVDDFAVLGEGFDPANQGTFRIVGHNGRNHLIIFNEQGGKDELIDADTLSQGGTGDRKWRVGALTAARPLRILAGECVRIGDRLRISTPPSVNQWFNSDFFGSWKITKIGFQGIDYTGASLPHTTSSGSASQTKICPYIEFEMPNAPLAVLDSVGAPVDKFLITTNDRAIGFVEEDPYFGVRMVSGYGVNPQDTEKADLFMVPKFQSSKMSDTFGTILTAFGKSGYVEQTYQGIDGYKIFNGLVQQAHRIIDGLPTNTVLFPGVKAAGAGIEVLPPLIKAISVALQVRPKDGVTLNSITELVKSTVANYVNSLGVGKPVVISEIGRVVQSLPGVFSVKILGTLPEVDDDRIVIGDIEKAFILDVTRDITVG